jgi:hypothetical protein
MKRATSAVGVNLSRVFEESLRERVFSDRLRRF